MDTWGFESSLVRQFAKGNEMQNEMDASIQPCPTCGEYSHLIHAGDVAQLVRARDS